MDDRTKAAFEAARDTTKQLITLSSAIITLSITFSKDFLKLDDNISKLIALLSWGAFFLAIFFGLWTLLAITGTLDNKNKLEKISIYERNIASPAFLQIIAFLLGLALLIIFAIVAMTRS